MIFLLGPGQLLWQSYAKAGPGCKPTYILKLNCFNYYEL